MSLTNCDDNGVLQAPHKPRPTRGVPPPPTFRFSELDPDILLAPLEAAGVLRISYSTLEHWRRYRPDHPLRWVEIDGRPRYRVGDMRAFMKGKGQK